MPAKQAGGAGGATRNIAQFDSSAPTHCHVLTNAHGYYTALLCCQTGRLRRLPRGVRA